MTFAWILCLLAFRTTARPEEPLARIKSETNNSMQFGKGFVRGPRTTLDYVGILQITQADRDNAPAVSDWTGAISAVKNQGNCGSCWAYSTTEEIETAYWFATGRPDVFELFSDQQIISCDSSDNGCQGGDPMHALDYVLSAGGLEPETDYSDTSSSSGNKGACSFDSGDIIPLGLKWWRAVPPCEGGSCSSQDEDGLAAAVAKYGPMSICLNANWDNHLGWHYDGVYTGVDGTCSSDYSKVDHCVQLVGYDKSASPPYWNIRNSWSTNWGDNGFIKIPYGQNYCGVANEAFLVQVQVNNGVWNSTEPRAVDSQPVSHASLIVV